MIRNLRVTMWCELLKAMLENRPLTLLENTKKADLRPIADVDVPEDAEIFCVPVSENWGL